MLRLYFAPGASSMAPHIALFEAGADFEGQAVSFKKDQNKTARSSLRSIRSARCRPL